jgi:hypothetical protein
MPVELCLPPCGRNTGGGNFATDSQGEYLYIILGRVKKRGKCYIKRNLTIYTSILHFTYHGNQMEKVG